MARSLGIMCATLAVTAAVLAQSGRPAGDPITGKWKGMVGPGTSPEYGVTFDLKFDGTRTVSGSAQGQEPGDTGMVRTGTYDPQTGVLRLEVQRKDAGATATFDGVVVQGMAMGRLTLSDQPSPGTFLLKRATASETPIAAAPASTEVNAAVAKQFAQVSSWILKAAELVPADKYAYRPVGTVRTFGQLIGHIADSHNYECGRAAGRKVEWSDTIEKATTDKATVIPKLKQSIETCTAAQNTGQIAPLVANVAHSNLHYGNVVTYLRLLGLVPPSS